MFYLSALLVGFLGSFHCAGMCGPIALALPGSGDGAARVTGRFLYNGGRVGMYAILGFLVGLIGHTIAMAGFQQYLSLASGMLIIVFAVGSIFYHRIRLVNGLLVRYTAALKNTFRELFGRRSRRTLFLIGLVNGLLPCGFVYVALAASAAAGSVTGSAAYMVLFGLGTVPMMLFISLAGNFFGMRFNRVVRQATPYVAIVVALFLITRGLNMPVHACCHR